MADKSNTAVPGKPRRRWFQCRLRTLLVGVVLLGSACGYVAREARIVAARKAFPSWAAVTALPPYMSPHPENGPSALRRWLGDREYILVEVATAGDVPAAEAVFPEAGVEVRDAYLPLR
jgi:hypothetical protein